MSDQGSEIEAIDDPIAEDYWSYTLDDGSERVSQVIVGRPHPAVGDERGDWCCPLYFEHITPNVLMFFGVGPVDALMNAMRFVADQFFKLGKVTPRARP